MKFLSTLPKVTAKGSRRLGRGTGSGRGQRAGRGGKGQTARVGKPIPLWFEGGQLAMTKRLPYIRGKSRFKTLSKETQLITLTKLDSMKSKEITPATLKAAKLISIVAHPIKIMGDGKVTKVFAVSGGVKTTKSAKAAIEKAGGTVA
ncbi:MAG TPA: 50S ribosomal protein L15 [Candidatus Saccharimonadia bacterium]|nr:50S ribosomal protein L15 [Candidatus Saccharimonadia bacterium]